MPAMTAGPSDLAVEMNAEVLWRDCEDPKRCWGLGKRGVD
jgi:hypothetical protein